MEVAIVGALSSLLGVSVGGFISYFLQKQKNDHERKLNFDENKTDNMAEQTASYYLCEDDRYERSFNHLKTKLGGFDQEELRKILVRAGAVRFIREETQEEYWCLVSRLKEKYKNDRNKKKRTN
jgi:hypothetical protein